MTLNMDGQLLETPRDGVVAVQIGNMRATLPTEQLRPLKKTEAHDAERKSARQTASVATGVGEIAMRKQMHISPELMLRAMRADEAQSLLDKYVDDAYAAGLQQGAHRAWQRDGRTAQDRAGVPQRTSRRRLVPVGQRRRRRRRHNGRDIQNVGET